MTELPDTADLSDIPTETLLDSLEAAYEKDLHDSTVWRWVWELISRGQAAENQRDELARLAGLEGSAPEQPPVPAKPTTVRERQLLADLVDLRELFDKLLDQSGAVER